MMAELLFLTKSLNYIESYVFFLTGFICHYFDIRTG